MQGTIFCYLFLQIDLTFNFFDCPLSLFFSEKRETEKPLVAASSPMAIGYAPFVHCVPKNDKLATLRQCHFLNGTPFSTLASADATNKEQVVTHLLMLKLCFNPCSYYFERLYSVWCRNFHLHTSRDSISL